MPGNHALLSPSSAGRFLTCTPSVRLEEQFPDSESEAAKEGTLAHAWAELMIQKHVGTITPGQYESLVDQLIVEDEKNYMDSAMEGYCEDYKNFVIAQLAKAKKVSPDAALFMEEMIELREYMPDSFGRLDIGIAADYTAYITDYKYGKGVRVPVKQNTQLKIYALGFIALTAPLYDIREVVMTIYQPRMGNIEDFTMSVPDLKQWANDYVVPRAKLAFEGKGEFVIGDHCRFCKARGVCEKQAEYNMELAQYAFADPGVLAAEQVADIIGRKSDFVKWITAVYDAALMQAVKHGKKYPGYKLVEGRSDRVIKDPAAVEAKFIEQGYTHEQLFKPEEMKGITALTKLVKPKKFEELTKGLLKKAPGDPALVPMDDTRPELNSLDSATAVFETEDDSSLL